MRAILLIALLLSLSFNLFAQSEETEESVVNTADTIPSFSELTSEVPVQELQEVAPEHDANKAAFFSAGLPGLGQIYNKKYWKVPIVWGGLAAFGYFINYYNVRYQFYRSNLLYEIEQDPNYPNETNLNQEQLRSARDFYRRNRDQLVLYGILFYFLNIVDAHVDAHLMEFNVNQDLSVRVTPELMRPLPNGVMPAGISLKFRF